jgi:hypothetical protein
LDGENIEIEKSNEKNYGNFIDETYSNPRYLNEDS